MEVAMCEEATEHKLFPSRSNEVFRGFCGGFSGDDLAEEDSDEIDLGLSLGGCFSSVDSRRKGIGRSSSIPSNFTSGLRSGIALSRVSSLPGETGEGMWGEEMDSIGGAERKRKGIEGGLEGGFMAKIRKVEVPNGGTCKFSPAFSSWIAGAAMPSEKFVPPASQSSNVSQGSSSSGGSELESRPKQDIWQTGLSPNNGSEVHQTAAERKSHEAPTSPSAMPRSKRVKGTAIASVGGHPLRKNDGRKGGDVGMLAEEMPLVSTRGDGRNGRRIQGFLYKCGNGEVRIVCVCHGSFLTPAEFVKHGGGGDVANPLKHIIVNPSSPPFL